LRGGFQSRSDRDPLRSASPRSDFRALDPRVENPCDFARRACRRAGSACIRGGFSCSRGNFRGHCMQCQSIRSLPFPAAIASFALGYPLALEQGRIKLQFGSLPLSAAGACIALCSKHIPKLTPGGGEDTVGRTYSAESCLPWTCWRIWTIHEKQIFHFHCISRTRSTLQIRRPASSLLPFVSAPWSCILSFWRMISPLQRKRASR
jgi:hypothetical protein